MPTTSNTVRNRSDRNGIEIQRVLRGFNLYTGKIDGVFGPKTLSAVRAFQRMHGLKDDGVIGPKTADAMFPKPFPDRQNLTLPSKPRTSVVQAVPRIYTPTYLQCMNYFGNVGTQQVKVDLPSGYDMWLAWDKRVKVRYISLHKKIADSAYEALSKIKEEFTAGERDALGLDLFGGSLNIRKMRGGNNWSVHAWGAAIDFDPVRNQLHWNSSRARLGKPDAEAFWRIWEEAGWTSLGRARNYDWMHVQAVQL